MSLFKKNYKTLDDEGLMRCICSGKTRAFEVLYDRYSGKMQYYFFRMLNRDEEKANDFLQELFMKIVEAPEKFDLNRKFSTWIYTVAGNMCKNEYRRQAVRGNTVPLTEQHESIRTLAPPNGYDNELFRDALQKALHNMPETHRTTFVLRFQEGLSIKAISEVMEVSEGTVKSRIFYTNKKLADQLKIFDPKKKRHFHEQKHY